MTNPLVDNIVQKLMRSLEASIYSVALDLGYTPNRETYANDPVGFAAKKADIAVRKKFCVDIFGHGSPHDRDTKYIPRIILTGKGFLPGSLGNDADYYYKENTQNSYDKMLAPFRSSNYRFEVELASNKSEQDSVLEYLRATGLPNLSYIPVYDNIEDTILIQYESYRDMPQLTHGLIQRTYTYSIIDIFETLPKTIGATIAKIKEINVVNAEDQSTILKLPKP
jgi:hypothetical protein